MVKFGAIEADLEPIYVNLGNTLGAYIIEPGEPPYIVLNSSLNYKQDPTANLVYNALVAFHRELPEVYKLFPMRQYYEDLPHAVPAPEPEIIIFARPSRRWGYAAYFPDEFRLIG